MRRSVAIGALSIAALCASQARAQGTPKAASPAVAPPAPAPPAAASPKVVLTPEEARAETLFNAAKQLRDVGQLAEACPLFAESKRLAPGVGVTLHLADCYERMGKTASAWTQYREAETLARLKRDDKRADLARDRAHALEAKVGRLTLTAGTASHDGWQVQLDGNPVPPEMWNAALAVDPIDHSVTVSSPGKPQRTLKAHLDASTLAAIVSLDEADTAGAAVPVATPAVVPAEPAPTEATSEPSGSAPGDASKARMTRTWAEIVLGGVGVVGLGLGTVFLVKKNQSMSNGNACDAPSEDKQAATASAVAYSIGAAAIAAGVIVYLTTPGHDNQVGVTLSPSVLWGGGGATVQSRF